MRQKHFKWKSGALISTVIFSVFLLAGCSGGGGGAVPAAPAGTTVGLQGNVVGTAAPAGLLAAAAVPLAGDVAVVVVDETGKQAASQVVNAGSGQFSVTVPEGHQYVVVFRQGTNQGKTLGVLAPDATGKTTISLPAGAPDVNLGNIVIDPKTGKAACLTEVAVAHPDAELADTDGDGVPDVADLSDDEDGDGVADSADALAFDNTESVDTDGDGVGNNADTDDDNDGVADAEDAFPVNSAASVDTDGDGKPDSATATQAQKNLMLAQGLTPDNDDDGDGIPNAQDPAPLAGISNIPTESPFGASPLDFGNGVAGAFEQQMILFEEFGPEPMPAAEAAAWSPLPQPQNAQNGPLPTAIEPFLAQAGVSPFPTEFSNVDVANPWNGAIEAFLGHPLESLAPLGVAGPAEGRPSGEDWKHQRWAELYPKKFFKTGLGQSRVNEGLRDDKQRHRYALGEFAPGGLYHRVYTFGTLALDGTTSGIAIKFHPNLPEQAPNSIWTFDGGTLPPKLLQARYGEPILMRNYNMLPIDVGANNGFGRHTITTHEHNGHSPGESDGFAFAYFFPGQFYDYRWPMQLAGYSSNNNSAGVINPLATEPKAAIPCEAGESFPVLVNGLVETRTCQDGRVMIPGDWRETMSTHWFHDHMLDYTSQNVYKGNATMMNYYSALDRGNEAIKDGINLCFPSGTALNWGNRDYDVNLVVADKAWDQNGQMWFNTAQHEGFLGDRMTVNFLYKPYFDVRARQYRFRFLNGSVSRIMSIGLVQEVNIPAGQPGAGELAGPAGSGKSYNRVPFHMIANDGNILEHAVPFDGVFDVMHDGNPDPWKGQLPSQTIAERYDIIVDFSPFPAGTKLYFVNIMEHADGKGTKSKVPMADIVSEKYNPIVQNGKWVNGDPGVGKFMELRVHAYAGTDLSMNPADYEPGKAKMIPLAIDRAAKTVNGVSLLTAKHHTFEFVHTGGGVDSSSPAGFGRLEVDNKDELTGQEELDLHGPWFIRVDGSTQNAANPQRISAVVNGNLEVWTIKTGRGWTHPVHIHFEEGIILTRGGKFPPEWEVWARKDMYRIGPENDSTGEVEIAYRARDFLGHYVQHCHNTMHEDHAMLMRWDARTDTARLIDTPIPTWDGVLFEPSFVFDAGVGFGGDGIGPKNGVPLN